MRCVLLLVAVAVITVALEVQFEISGNASNRTAVLQHNHRLLPVCQNSNHAVDPMSVINDFALLG